MQSLFRLLSFTETRPRVSWEECVQNYLSCPEVDCDVDWLDKISGDVDCGTKHL